MMDVNDLIEKSETRIFRAVFPNTTNHYDTLFGGTALKMMDEAAFICATRFSRKKVVTVSTDKIDFTKPIPQGTIVELVARIDSIGRSSCVVRVDIFVEEMYSYNREKAVTGIFTFVAVNDEKKPIPILDLQ
ncbi:MAG: acyl-CoA thioesterase [Leeuwenhoekiella sp.]